MPFDSENKKNFIKKGKKNKNTFEYLEPAFILISHSYLWQFIWTATEIEEDEFLKFMVP